MYDKHVRVLFCSSHPSELEMLVRSVSSVDCSYAHTLSLSLSQSHKHTHSLSVRLFVSLSRLSSMSFISSLFPFLSFFVSFFLHFPCLCLLLFLYFCFSPFFSPFELNFSLFLSLFILSFSSHSSSLLLSLFLFPFLSHFVSRNFLSHVNLSPNLTALTLTWTITHCPIHTLGLGFIGSLSFTHDYILAHFLSLS